MAYARTRGTLQRTRCMIRRRHKARSGLAMVRSVSGRRLGALLGVIALLMQVWVPLVHRSPPAAANAWLLGSICHVDFGNQADRSSAPGDPAGSGSHKAPLCPICYLLMLGGTFLLPVLGAILLRRLPCVVLGHRPAPLRFSAVGYALAQPRGPPLAA